MSSADRPASLSFAPPAFALTICWMRPGEACRCFVTHDKDQFRGFRVANTANTRAMRTVRYTEFREGLLIGIYQRKDRTGIWISWSDAQGRRRCRKRTHKTSLTQARKIRSADLLRVEQARVFGFSPPGEETFGQVAVRFLAHQKARLTVKATTAFRRACARISILDFRFHDLRHTAAIWLRMQGAVIHTVGNCWVISIFAWLHAINLSSEFLVDAVGRLDEVFGTLCYQDVTIPKALVAVQP